MCKEGHTASKCWTFCLSLCLSDSKAHAVFSKLDYFCVYTDTHVWVALVRDKYKAKALLA